MARNKQLPARMFEFKIQIKKQNETQTQMNSPEHTIAIGEALLVRFPNCYRDVGAGMPEDAHQIHQIIRLPVLTLFPEHSNSDGSPFKQKNFASSTRQFISNSPHRIQI